MAEEKRIFNGATMDRDIDDRLLPAGKYRYGLNINIGESEGGDIGALENLKGNELITGQDNIEGTTIGSIRDPNNDRFYWFTKGDTFDAIYEYDGTSVNTILKDSVDRANVKPTCTPSFTFPLQTPASDVADRPAFDAFPASPVGYCNIQGRPNFLERADGTGAQVGFDFVDNSICEAAPPDPPANTLSVTVANVSGQAGGGDLMLTAVPSDAQGTPTYEWFASAADRTAGTPVLNTGATTTVTDPGVEQTITRFVRATDTAGTADAQGDAIFTATPPFDYTISHSGSFTGATLMPTAATMTFSGTDPLAVDFVSQQVLDANTRWTAAGIPTATTTNPDGLTFTQTTGAGQTDNLQARLMGNVNAAGTASITWSGGVTEPIPAAFTGSVAISTWPDYIISTSGSGDVTGTSAGANQATYAFSNLPAGVFLFNAAISWSSPSLGNFFTENRAISTILSNPVMAGFNIDFPDTLPAGFTETLTATIAITVSGGAFDGTNVPITAGATQTSDFA